MLSPASVTGPQPSLVATVTKLLALRPAKGLTSPEPLHPGLNQPQTGESDVKRSSPMVAALTHPDGRAVCFFDGSDASSWNDSRSTLQALADTQLPILAIVFGLDWDLAQSDVLESQYAIHRVDVELTGSLEAAIDEALETDDSTILLVSGQTQGSRQIERSDGEQHRQTARPCVRSTSAYVDSDVARQDRAAIWKKSLSSNARRWIAEYERVGTRELYLWQWCLHGIELTTLPSVSQPICTALCDTKLLSVIVCVLFDDVADEIHDVDWLNDLIDVVRAPREAIAAQNPRIREHITTTRELWGEYTERVRQLPAYSEMAPIWQFDIEQFLTAMRYGQLVNQFPDLANPTEHDVYTPHNMLMVSFGTLDMMGSDGVATEDRGAIREALWHSQAMGRVGNVLSTWRREVENRDFSNRMVCQALSEGAVRPGDLEDLPADELKRLLLAERFEDELMDKWKRHRHVSHEVAKRVRSIDLRPVLAAHDRFFEMHLGCIGLI